MTNSGGRVSTPPKRYSNWAAASPRCGLPRADNGRARPTSPTVCCAKRGWPPERHDDGFPGYFFAGRLVLQRPRAHFADRAKLHLLLAIGDGLSGVSLSSTL